MAEKYCKWHKIVSSINLYNTINNNLLVWYHKIFCVIFLHVYSLRYQNIFLATSFLNNVVENDTSFSWQLQDHK